MPGANLDRYCRIFLYPFVEISGRGKLGWHWLHFAVNDVVFLAVYQYCVAPRNMILTNFLDLLIQDRVAHIALGQEKHAV